MPERTALFYALCEKSGLAGADPGRRRRVAQQDGLPEVLAAEPERAGEMRRIANVPQIEDEVDEASVDPIEPGAYLVHRAERAKPHERTMLEAKDLLRVGTTGDRGPRQQDGEFEHPRAHVVHAVRGGHNAEGCGSHSGHGAVSPHGR